MWSWIRELDRILRGEATQLTDLREGIVKIPAGGISVILILLAMVYGLCMGCFAVFNVEQPRYLQLLATTLKVPVLFFLTLVVTFPSLYVFSALVGSRLSVRAIYRLLIAALGVNLALLASLGPIVAFFSICTSSYSFMVLLNVVIFAVSGVLGLVFLLQTLQRLSTVAWEPISMLPATEATVSQTPEREPSIAEDKSDSDQTDIDSGEVPPTAGSMSITPDQIATVLAERAPEPGPLDSIEDQVLSRHVTKVFSCWVVLFGLVGAQMSWVLRPFIGSPGSPFEWFRPRQSNFFESVLQTVASFFS